jgi:hypothetical protein
VLNVSSRRAFQFPASTSLPAAARSTSCRYVSRVIIGYYQVARGKAAVL